MTAGHEVAPSGKVTEPTSSSIFSFKGCAVPRVVDLSATLLIRYLPGANIHF